MGIGVISGEGVDWVLVVSSILFCVKEIKASALGVVGRPLHTLGTWLVPESEQQGAEMEGKCQVTDILASVLSRRK